MHLSGTCQALQNCQHEVAVDSTQVLEHAHSPEPAQQELMWVIAVCQTQLLKLWPCKAVLVGEHNALIPGLLGPLVALSLVQECQSLRGH